MNVINDPWMFVEYLDGTKKQISVRQAFIDAEKIKHLDTPVFHGIKTTIYDLSTIRLLSIILSATYYKPENNFKAKKEYFFKDMFEKGWNLEDILAYLDKWEYKFNVEDAQYPFLQYATLEETPNEDSSYISKISPIAPGMANKFFGPIRSNGTEEENGDCFISLFNLSMDELVYVLLYNATLNSSCMAARYPHKSLDANSSVFVLPVGKNLRETIIYNCLPLTKSFRPDEEDEDKPFDRPIWELNGKDDIEKYKKYEDMYNNVLLCSILPTIPMKAFFEAGKVTNITLAGGQYKDAFFTPDEEKALTSGFLQANPWVISNMETKKDGTIAYSVSGFKDGVKLISLCISMTSTLPDKFQCNIVRPELQENHDAQCIVYFRKFTDEKKTKMQQFGTTKVDQDVFDTLYEENKHKDAEIFETAYTTIYNQFKVFTNKLRLALQNADAKRLYDSKYHWDPQDQFLEHFENKMTNYFLNTFCTSLGDDDCLNNAVNYMCDTAKEHLAKFFNEFCLNSRFVMDFAKEKQISVATIEKARRNALPQPEEAVVE